MIIEHFTFKRVSIFVINLKMSLFLLLKYFSLLYLNADGVEQHALVANSSTLDLGLTVSSTGSHKNGFRKQAFSQIFSDWCYENNCCKLDIYLWWWECEDCIHKNITFLGYNRCSGMCSLHTFSEYRHWTYTRQRIKSLWYNVHFSYTHDTQLLVYIANIHNI